MDEQDSRSRTRRTFLEHGAIGVSSLALAAGTAGAAPGRDRETQGSIQEKVDAAEPGDTVEIDSGEYSERVDIDKPLTLRGATGTTAGGGTPEGEIASGGTPDDETDGGPAIDRPTVDARGFEHGILVEAEDVTVEGFEVVGDDATAAGITVFTDEADLTGVTIRHNYVSGMSGGTGNEDRQAFGILSYGANEVSDLTVTNNRIEAIGGDNDEDPQGVGINLQSIDGDEPGEGGLVERNEVREMADANLDVTFASPSGFDRNVPPFGVALTIQPLDGDDSDAGSCGVLARRNVFENNSVDVVLGNKSDPMTSELTGNNLGEGDDFGVVNVGEAVPAECNYWGASSGPSHSGNLSGGGDIVLGKVDYRPWSKEEFEPEGEGEIACSGGETTDGGG